MCVVTLADNLLEHTKKLLHGHGNVRLGHRWPTSHAQLRARISKKCGRFWDNVTYSGSVDISRFGLPVTSVQYTFVDPIFVWLQQCDKLLKLGKKLYFEPKVLRDSAGDELFGSGVQYGYLLRAARNSIPHDALPALINLSWDEGDTHMASRGVCPICLQVMNTNTGNENAVGLVGYLPQIEVSAVAKTTKEFKRASLHVLQTVIGAILTRIEAPARHGFTGHLKPY